MPKGWRFRSSIFGTLVLQVYCGSDGPLEFWRDATTKDYAEFIEAVKGLTP